MVILHCKTLGFWIKILFLEEGPNPCERFQVTGLNLSVAACPTWRMGVTSSGRGQGFGGGPSQAFDSLSLVFFPLVRNGLSPPQPSAAYWI